MKKLDIAAKLSKENPEFVAEVQGLSVEQLDARLAQLAKDGEAVEDAKEADEAYQVARTGTKEMGAPYRDAKKALRLKSRYVIGLIREKGGA